MLPKAGVPGSLEETTHFLVNLLLLHLIEHKL